MSQTSCPIEILAALGPIGMLGGNDVGGAVQFVARNLKGSKMPSIKELREKRGELNKKRLEIINKAESEDRDLTQEEDDILNQCVEDDKEIANRIKRQEEANAHNEDLSRAIELAGQRRGIAVGGGSTSGRGGFRFVDSHGVEHQALGAADSFARAEDREGQSFSPEEFGRAFINHITGRHDRASERFRNALSGTGNGGIVLSPWLSQVVVDYARAQSVCIAAGAQTIRMDQRELTVLRLLNDPVPQWRAEGSPIAISGMSFGAFKMNAQTLAVRVPMTVEMLEDSSNAGQLVMSSIESAIGLGMDQAGLAGQGFSFFPGGLLNVDGTNVQSAIGAVNDYSKFSKGIGAILGQNFPGTPAELSWIKRPALAVTLDQLTAADSGQPLQPTPMVSQLKPFHTTSLEEGTSIVGDFRQMLFGMRTSGIRFQVTQAGNDEDGSPLVDSLKLQVVAYVRMDVCILRPGWFSVLKGISEA
jgi:HK97 family phage major capsid protein